LLFELVNGFGSPLNLLFPELILENKTKFLKVFKKHQILGKVYFAHKTNQSSSLVRQLAMESDSYIDVASVGELKHALQSGFTGKQIGATGPKTDAFLLLCIQHDVLVSVDNQQELDLIATIAKNLGKTTKITIRLNGFTSENAKVITKTSRFGIPLSEIGIVLQQVSQAKALELVGFAFHLDSTAIKERVIAIETLIKLVDQAQELGLNPHLINIGGGYKVSYLENQKQWDTYTSAIKEAVLGQRESFTWNGYSFGLWSENRKLKGTLNTYQFFDQQNSDKYLDEILSQPSSFSTQTLGEVLRDRMLEVMIEPGRSLADQCGITIGKVMFVKQSAQGENLLGLEMNRADVAFLEHEVFVDPLLVSNTDNQQPFSAYITGNLCLEGDFIFIRKINFPHTPRPGDVLIFANTAGYYSDFSAHSAIKQPRASKVAITQKNNRLYWSQDSLYKPAFKRK